eukprot:scaffold96565_cov63-Phaeocystis_antarctica.AAC.1
MVAPAGCLPLAAPVGRARPRPKLAEFAAQPYGVDPEGLAKRKSPKGKSGWPDMFSRSRLAIDRRPRWT